VSVVPDKAVRLCSLELPGWRGPGRHSLRSTGARCATGFLSQRSGPPGRERPRGLSTAVEAETALTSPGICCRNVPTYWTL
jgi:hypothetical protein